MSKQRNEKLNIDQNDYKSQHGAFRSTQETEKRSSFAHLSDFHSLVGKKFQISMNCYCRSRFAPILISISKEISTHSHLFEHIIWLGKTKLWLPNRATSSNIYKYYWNKRERPIDELCTKHHHFITVQWNCSQFSEPNYRRSEFIVWRWNRPRKCPFTTGELWTKRKKTMRRKSIVIQQTSINVFYAVNEGRWRETQTWVKADFYRQLSSTLSSKKRKINKYRVVIVVKVVKNNFIIRILCSIDCL